VEWAAKKDENVPAACKKGNQVISVALSFV